MTQADGTRSGRSSRAVDALARALDARHVAVFGASTTPGKWGHITVKEMLTSGYRGRLTLVNPRGGELFGHPLTGVEHAAGADLAVLDTPGSAAPEVIRTCGELGIGTAVVHAAGFAEIGNRALQDELVAAGHESGVRLIGPNCVGFFSSTSSLNVSLEGNLPRGNISAIVQSGSVATHAGSRFAQLGQGFDVMFAVGNKVDLGFTEALATIAERETTHSILLYLERLDEGDAFLEVLAEVTRDTPVVALMSGQTAMGRKAAMSHTGSMVSDWSRAKGLLEAAGAVVTDRLEAGIGAAAGTSRRAPLRGRRVYSICDGGGTAVLLSDALGRGGFTLPDASDQLRRRLAEHVPVHVAETNPLDFQGAAENDLFVYAHVLQAVLDSGEYDAVVIAGIIGGIGLFWGEEVAETERRMATRLAEIAKTSDLPILVQSTYASRGTEVFGILRGAGIPCSEWPEDVQLALRTRLPAASGPARPETEADSHPVHFDHGLVRETARLVEALERRGVQHALGAPMTENDRVAADGGRWVLRLDGYAHKTDAGAIALGVTAETFPQAMRRLTALGRRSAEVPVVRVAAYLPHDHEVLVTFFRDPLQGTGFVIGAGGTGTESLADVAVGRLPTTPAGILDVLSSTRLGQRLGGQASPEARAALATCVMALASLFTEELTDLAELEVNPIGLTVDSAVVLDILPTPAH